MKLRLDGKPRAPRHSLAKLSPLEKVERRRTQQAALNTQRRAAGLCTWCGLPAAPYALCEVHRDANSQRKKLEQEREARHMALWSSKAAQKKAAE